MLNDFLKPQVAKKAVFYKENKDSFATETQVINSHTVTTMPILENDSDYSNTEKQSSEFAG